MTGHTEAPPRLDKELREQEVDGLGAPTPTFVARFVVPTAREGTMLHFDFAAPVRAYAAWVSVALRWSQFALKRRQSVSHARVSNTCTVGVQRRCAARRSCSSCPGRRGW